jgi:UDP-N-acetyl-D-mannosaminuronate dehydrogenase
VAKPRNPLTALQEEPELSRSSSEIAEATVLVIGLGEVGRPLFEVLGPAHDVVARDLEDVPVDEVGILHICFPFGEAFVQSVCDYVASYQPSLVIVNSTVVPGTTRAIEDGSGVPTLYSPVRGKHVRMKDELLTYEKFLAGTSEVALVVAERHFKEAGLVTHRMSSPEALELAKLLETSYFGLLIAWAQEMDRFASAVSADYGEILEFFGEVAFLPSTRFQPGFIGGHCVMPNLSLLEEIRESPFIDAIRQSNAKRESEWRSVGNSLSDRLSPL